MSEPEVITLKLIPSGGDLAEVDAEDFQRQLSALLSALKESAKQVNGSAAEHVRYKIQNVSNNSPVNVVLRGQPSFGADPIDVEQIHRVFSEGMKLVSGALADDAKVPGMWFEKMAEFCRPIGQAVNSAFLTVGGTTYEIGLAFKVNLMKLRSRGHTEKGSHIKGKMEAINIHGKKLVFTIWPDIGPDRVVCRMSSNLTAQAHKLLGHDIIVHGDLKYHWKDPFPYEVKASHFEELTPEDESPGLEELWGIAPNATNGLSVEDFIAALRDGE